MDELSAEARLADGVETPLAVAVPRAGVEEALQHEGADLILDLVRTNGQREERRIAISLDRRALEALVAQEGEQVLIALDAASLAGAFDDVEAHGMREVGATLAIVVAAVAGGAGTAAGAISPHDGTGAVVATVDAGMPRAMPSDYAQARASEEQMPRAMPADYAQADESGAQLRRDPGAVSNIPATTEVADRGIENVRAAQPAPTEAPDATSGIESVRVGGTAVPDPSTAIENVRAERSPAETGDGGISVSVPNAGVTAALAGGAALTIAAAAFALRRRREPEPAT